MPLAAKGVYVVATHNQRLHSAFLPRDVPEHEGVGDRIIVNFSDTGWSCGLVESSLVAKVTRGGTNGQMCDIDPRKRANFSVLWPCEVVDGKTLRSSLFLGKNNVGSVWALIGEK